MRISWIFYFFYALILFIVVLLCIYGNFNITSLSLKFKKAEQQSITIMFFIFVKEIDYTWLPFIIIEFFRLLWLLALLVSVVFIGTVSLINLNISLTYLGISYFTVFIIAQVFNLFNISVELYSCCFKKFPEESLFGFWFPSSQDMDLSRCIGVVWNIALTVIILIVWIFT